MNAKQLIATLAIVSVIFASFAAVSADAEDGYEIDAQYKVTSYARVIVDLPTAVPENDRASISITGDNIDEIQGVIGFLSGNTKGVYRLAEPLADGVYQVVVTGMFGTSAPATLTVGDAPVEPKIVKIEAEATETTYYVGQKFDASKMTVTATYDDENTAVLAADAYKYAPDGELALTDTQIIVTLKDDVTITDTIEIIVKERVVTTTVTFVISEGYTKAVTTVVGEPVDKPADPVVEGVDFIGWFTEAGEQFDFATAIQGETTLIAHFGPKALPPTQTEKFVVAVSGEDRTVVVTAYDEKIIGKGTAIVKLYEKVDFLGMTMYSEVEDARQNLTISCNGFVFIEDVSDKIADFTAGGGEFALEATVTLNGIEQTSTYAPFIVLDKA